METPIPFRQPGAYISAYLMFAFIGLLLILSLTRVLSARRSSSRSIRHDGARSVPAVPYWIPFLGHLPSMGWDADGFVKNLRHCYTNGIFALNLGGSAHNIVYTPGLATALLNQKPGNANSEGVGNVMMSNVFGLPSDQKATWMQIWSDVAVCYKHLLTEPSLGQMVQQTVDKTKENVLDLVTFATSPVDQTPWERTSDVQVKTNSSGEQVAEASLLPLIRDFCAHTANATIMGSDFLAKFPDFFDDLWPMDRGFLLLGTGLPRWFPIPALTRAHIARKKLLDKIYIFHDAMEKHMNGQDPGPDWRDLDDVSTLVKERTKVYRKNGLSIRGRAASELALNWASNANSNVLVFWMVNRIYADKALLAQVREEIGSYVAAVQPKQELAFAEPPRLEVFDVDGLCNDCPLLKSCYVECLRLDTASWSLKVVQQDFVLQSRERDSQAWMLRKGEYAHAAHDLHNTDPDYFDDPMTWKADRHIKFDGDEKKRTADLGSIRPYGGGSSMCKGRSFAFKECMAFVAAIIALWDIEPANGAEWKIPRHRKATGVYGTPDETRVGVKRRELPR